MYISYESNREKIIVIMQRHDLRRDRDFFLKTSYWIEIIVLLRCYAAQIGIQLRMFPDNTSVLLQRSRLGNMGSISYLETSANIKPRCITPKKNEDVIYTAVETSSHASAGLIRYSRALRYVIILEQNVNSKAIPMLICSKNVTK